MRVCFINLCTRFRSKKCSSEEEEEIVHRMGLGARYLFNFRFCAGAAAERVFGSVISQSARLRGLQSSALQRPFLIHSGMRSRLTGSQICKVN